MALIYIAPGFSSLSAFVVIVGNDTVYGSRSNDPSFKVAYIGSPLINNCKFSGLIVTFNESKLVKNTGALYDFSFD